MGKFVQLNSGSHLAKFYPVGYVIQEDGCWEWRGYRHCGYGQVSPALSSGTSIAHRWMYETKHGPIPKGTDCHHLCGKKDCVNPSHIKLMTHREHSIMNERQKKRAKRQ